MLRRIWSAVFVHFASDSDSRCLSFFTHRENLPGVHRHAEQAHLRATTRWHALCLIPSQSDRHKQPQWDDLPNRPESIYELLEKLHTAKNIVFETCVTDTARELFDHA